MVARTGTQVIGLATALAVAIISGWLAWQWVDTLTPAGQARHAAMRATELARAEHQLATDRRMAEWRLSLLTGPVTVLAWLLVAAAGAGGAALVVVVIRRSGLTYPDAAGNYPAGDRATLRALGLRSVELAPQRHQVLPGSLATYTHNPSLRIDPPRQLVGGTTATSEEPAPADPLALLPPPGTRLASALAALPVPSGQLLIGQGAGGQVVTWEPRSRPHLVVCGQTGSGKTTAGRGLVAQEAAEGAGLVVVDLKFDGQAWRPLLGSVIAPPAVELPEAAVLLEAVVAEMERRYRIYNEVGDAGLVGYQRLVLWLDEFAALTGNRTPAARPFTARCQAAIDRILRLGRTANIAVIAMAQDRQSQSLNIGGGTLSNFNARWLVGEADDQTVRVLLGGDHKLPIDALGLGISAWRVSGQRVALVRVPDHGAADLAQLVAGAAPVGQLALDWSAVGQQPVTTSRGATRPGVTARDQDTAPITPPVPASPPVATSTSAPTAAPTDTAAPARALPTTDSELARRVVTLLTNADTDGGWVALSVLARDYLKRNIPAPRLSAVLTALRDGGWLEQRVVTTELGRSREEWRVLEATSAARELLVS